MNQPSSVGKTSKHRESTAEGTLAAFKIIIENMPPIPGLILGGREVQAHPQSVHGSIRAEQLELF